MAVQKGNVVSFQNTMITEWSAIATYDTAYTFSIFTPAALCFWDRNDDDDDDDDNNK